MAKDKWVRRWHWLARLLLGALALFLLLYWSHIPQEIPLHYNASGQIDRWGNKGSILVLVVITLVLYGMLSAVELFPGAWNTGVKVTEANREAVYRILARMLAQLKAIFVMAFAYLIMMVALVLPLGKYFIVLMVGVPLGILGYGLWRLWQVR